MGYEIVAYTPAMDARIAQLQTHLWSGDAARNAAYLAWKYTENPYTPEPHITLAMHDGQLVGMRGLFGMLWEVDGAARHAIPCADDLVIVPAQRNRGMVSRIMRVCFDDAARHGFRFAVSLSAAPVTFISSLAAGWRVAGAYQSVIRQLPTPPLLARARPLFGGRVGALVAAMRRRFAATPFAALDRAVTRNAGPLSLSRTPRPEAMAELVARRPWDGRIRHVRDARYLAWRYRNPLHKYRFLFWDDGGLQGYLVLQRYLSDRADRTRVNITDWEGDDHVRAALLAVAVQHGRFAQLHAWTATESETSRALLRTHGFNTPPAGDLYHRSQGLLVRALGEGSTADAWRLGGRDLLDIHDWDLRMIYSMIG